MKAKYTFKIELYLPRLALMAKLNLLTELRNIFSTFISTSFLWELASSSSLNLAKRYFFTFINGNRMLHIRQRDGGRERSCHILPRFWPDQQERIFTKLGALSAKQKSKVVCELFFRVIFINLGLYPLKL